MNNKPHKHAELIKAWADGATIQIKTLMETVLGPAGTWVDIDPSRGAGWFENREYRVKPEVTTSLSGAALRKLYYAGYGLPDTYDGVPESHSRDLIAGLKVVADAAIKQYIKDTQK